MKVLRISASVLALSSLALLAACGGGGGGGAAPPTSPPGGSPPPTSTPTPGKTATPSPKPTSTPVKTPTPTPTATPTGTIASNGIDQVVDDGASGNMFTFGKDGWQTNGVTDPEGAADGDIAGGFTSASQTSIDSVSCTLGTEPGTGQYHVHTFVGLYVNGKQYAIPDAIGMINPSGDGANAPYPYPNQGFTQGCTLHTHGESGIIHIEDTALNQSFTTLHPEFNLQSLLDIWGQKSIAAVATATAGFSGPVAIYAGNPCMNNAAPNNAIGCANPQKDSHNNDVVTNYAAVGSNPSSVQFGHHVAVWIVVGPMPAAGLPSISFGIEN